MVNHQTGVNSAPGPQLLVLETKPWLTPMVTARITQAENNGGDMAKLM